MLTRRCAGRVTTRTGSHSCPLEGMKVCRDGRWRCLLHAKEFTAAHPDVSEREAIQSDGPPKRAA